MKNRILRTLQAVLNIVFLLNFISVISCQNSKKHHIIMNDYSKYGLDDFKKIFGNSIPLFPLRYEDYTDKTYKRTVLTEEKMEKFSTEIEYFGNYFDYCDIYLVNNKIIGFKASIAINADINQSQLIELQHSIVKNNGKLIALKVKEKDKSALFINQYKYKEWESERYVIANYHISESNKNISNSGSTWIIVLNKDEIKNIPKQILATEFDHITLFRKDSLKHREINYKSNPESKDIYEKMKNNFKQIPIQDGK